MKNLSNEQIRRVVERARALSDVTRLRLLQALSRAEQSVSQLAALLDTEPSMVSKHLQVLFHARLVERRREARTVIYSLVSPDVMEICRYLSGANLAASRRSGRRA